MYLAITRRAWRFALFTEITEAVLPEREASDANFRLLLLAAQTVKRTGKAELPLAYFALWTVKLGGWLPPLDRCAFCGKALAAGCARVFRAERFGDRVRQMQKAGHARDFRGSTFRGATNARRTAGPAEPGCGAGPDRDACRAGIDQRNARRDGTSNRSQAEIERTPGVASVKNRKQGSKAKHDAAKAHEVSRFKIFY